MKLSYIFFVFMLFIGCSDTPKAQTLTQTEPFNVSRSASQATLAPVPINSKILLNITTDLNESTVTNASVYIQDDSNTTIDTLATYQQRVISIAPQVYLQPHTNYTIFITTAIESIQGEHLSKDINFSFSSAGALPDTEAPIYIGNNIDYPLQPKSIYYFQFNEPISPLSVTADMLQITEIINDYNITSSVKVSGPFLIFTPNEDLKDSTTLGNDAGYKIVLTIDNRIQDLSGNSMTPSQVELSSSILRDDVYPTRLLPLQTESYPTHSKIKALYPLDNYLYIGSNKGLEVVDFNFSTAHFSTLDRLPFTDLGTVYSIEGISGQNRIYVGTSKGMYIIDVSDKNNIKIINKYLTPAPVYNLTHQGDHLYLAATLEGLIDLNISNETKIQKLFTKPTAGIAFDVYLNDQKIYVTDYNNSIQIHELNGSISIVAPPDFYGHAKSMVYNYDQNHILITAGIEGVQSWDSVSYFITYSYRLPSYATKTEVVNNFVYVNAASLGIFTYSSIDYYSDYHEMLVPSPFINIETFTYMGNTSATLKYLILADKLGTLYSTKLP